MRVLLDTNVILDQISLRQPFVNDSNRIINLCTDRQIEGFIAAHSVTNIFYILRHEMSLEERRKVLIGFCSLLTVVGIDKEKLVAALENEDFSDVEDCLQTECAKSCGADYIVTRNVKDFQNSVIPAIMPDEFLKLINN